MAEAVLKVLPEVVTVEIRKDIWEEFCFMNSLFGESPEEALESEINASVESALDYKGQLSLYETFVGGLRDRKGFVSVIQ